MRERAFFVTIFWVLCLVILCTPLATYSQTSFSNDQLPGTEWKLVSFGPLGRETPIVDGTDVTLNFGSDSSASGSAGCNSYRGTYRVQGNSITFSRLVSTRRACLDERANQQEQRYLAALESATRFRLDANRLTVYPNRGRDVLNFAQELPESTGGQRYEDLSSPVGLLTSFYNAINSRDYQRAYRYWETPPANLDDFSREYRNSAEVRLLVEPPIRIEGAAGSLYAEVPTILIARLRNGRERMFVGCYVMRRSNVPSSSGVVSSNAWRISQATLSPASPNTGVSALLAQACTNP
jgi:heat shock protein HslJ